MATRIQTVNHKDKVRDWISIQDRLAKEIYEINQHLRTGEVMVVTALTEDNDKVVIKENVSIWDIGKNHSNMKRRKRIYMKQQSEFRRLLNNWNNFGMKVMSHNSIGKLQLCRFSRLLTYCYLIRRVHYVDHIKSLDLNEMEELLNQEIKDFKNRTSPVINALNVIK